MPTYIISRHKIFDRKRFHQMQESFLAIKPPDAIVLAGDHSPTVTSGEDHCDHASIVVFHDRTAALNFIYSPECRNFVILREACAQTETMLIDGDLIDLDTLSKVIL